MFPRHPRALRPALALSGLLALAGCGTATGPTQSPLENLRFDASAELGPDRCLHAGTLASGGLDERLPIWQTYPCPGGEPRG